VGKKYPYGEGKVRWVSTQWLGEHLEDEQLMILDVQPNVHDYIQEHVPGAVYMNEGLLRVPLRGLPAQYVPPDAVQAVVRRVGLKPDVPVVVYTGVGPFSGGGNGLEQTMSRGAEDDGLLPGPLRPRSCVRPRWRDRQVEGGGESAHTGLPAGGGVRFRRPGAQRIRYRL